MARMLHSALLLLAFSTLAAGAEAPIRVRGRIIEKETGQPIPARLEIQAESGAWHFARSAVPEGSAREYRRQAGIGIEQHVTLSAHPFEVDLPPGRYTFTVERGKEYRPLEHQLMVSPGMAEVTLPLSRWIHMADRHWYSGDVHAHVSLADMPNLVMAEDLNVGCVLSHWVTAAGTTPGAGNRIRDPIPQPAWIAVDDQHGIYPLNTEYEIFTVGGKNHTLGAVLLCGQRSPLEMAVPPVRRVAELAHADGAFLDLEKHSWPWSPLIVPLMKVDLFELANNHCWRTNFGFPAWTLDAAPAAMELERTANGFTEWGWIDFGFKSYYAYLNCGFRMMPSAGSGAGVHPVPLGFGRVYVHVPGALTFDAWKANLLAGRSFVTTGPLMEIAFDGQHAGQTFRATGDHRVRVTGTIHSLNPIQRVEIVQNGDVVWTQAGPGEQIPAAPESATTSLRLDQTIPFTRSGWMIVRCFEAHPTGRIRFAHSAPIFVEITDRPQRPRRWEVEHFIERIERELKRHETVLSEEAVAEYREVLALYQGLLKQAE